MEHDRQNITAKARLLNEMNNTENHYSNAGMMIDASAIELNTTHGALYAETISNVCIIFTDIVGFSQVALDMNPIKVMDMLQDLFSRFDALCDKHGIRKLETIGDAYIATTDMFAEENGKHLRSNAVKALGVAKDMVGEARRVLIPKKNQLQPLEIRVGIHIGEVTAGVLGERLPKFTVFGTAVNVSARMEQTCLPSMIRVTKDFFDLLPASEVGYKKEVISTRIWERWKLI
jgi:class 3 adenylate cyclase